MLKFVPMHAASWLDSFETPSFSVSALRVTGIVAAVLAVLKVPAITSDAPRKKRSGDIPRNRTRTIRYQVT